MATITLLEAREVSRILREVIRQVEAGRSSGRVMDANGNSVGNWEKHITLPGVARFSLDMDMDNAAFTEA